MEDTVSEMKYSLLLITVAIVRISAFICASVLSLSSHRILQRGPHNTYYTHIVGFVTGENSELRDFKYFITGSKHACPLFQRETVSMPDFCS